MPGELLMGAGAGAAVDPNLVLHYTVTEGSGTTLHDLTANASDGTLHGGTSWVAGPTVSYDGSSGYVDCGSPATLRITGLLTVSAWFKLSSFSSGSAYVVAELGYDGSHTGYAIGFNNGLVGSGDHLNFVSYAGGTYGCHTSYVFSAADNGWIHVCGVWDGVAWHLYVNAVEDTVADGTQQNPASSTARFLLGAEDANGTPGRFFPGDIGAIRVYNRALSGSEVSALYALGQNG